MEDPTLGEILDKTETPETAPETETPEEKKPETVDYEARYKESQTESIRLAKELERLKDKPAPKAEDVPDDEKRVLDILEKREALKAQSQKEADDHIKKELDILHQVHGEFNDDKLLETIEEYGLYDENGGVNFNKAIQLYQKLGGEMVLEIHKR